METSSGDAGPGRGEAAPLSQWAQASYSSRIDDLQRPKPLGDNGTPNQLRFLRGQAKLERRPHYGRRKTIVTIEKDKKDSVSWVTVYYCRQYS